MNARSNRALKKHFKMVYPLGKELNIIFLRNKTLHLQNLIEIHIQFYCSQLPRYCVQTFDVCLHFYKQREVPTGYFMVAYDSDR